MFTAITTLIWFYIFTNHNIDFSKFLDITLIAGCLITFLWSVSEDVFFINFLSSIIKRKINPWEKNKEKRQD